MIPTGEQLRAARALLRLDQKALGEAAGVSAETVKRLESLTGPVSASAATVDALVRALGAAGVVFLEADGSGGPGVRIARTQAP